MGKAYSGNLSEIRPSEESLNCGVMQFPPGAQLAEKLLRETFYQNINLTMAEVYSENLIKVR